MIRRAQEQNLVQFDLADFFSFVAPKERIDAPTFGHGAGMLIKPEVVQKALRPKSKLMEKPIKYSFLLMAKNLDQKLLQKIATEASAKNHLMLIPARYEGMDARVEARICG